MKAIEKAACILVAAIIALVLAVSAAPRSALAAEMTVTGSLDSASAHEMLSLVNAERGAAGRASVGWNSDLESCCRRRAIEQALSFGHTRPNGTSWSTVYGGALPRMSENCAYRTTAYSASEANRSFVESAGHYANMIDAGVTTMAAACFHDARGNVYYVQMYAAGLPSTTWEDSSTQVFAYVLDF